MSRSSVSRRVNYPVCSSCDSECEDGKAAWQGHTKNSCGMQMQVTAMKPDMSEERQNDFSKQKLEEKEISNCGLTRSIKPSESKTESRDAVAILPEEVWEIILGNLSNSKDLWNCSRSCELFNQILLPSKSCWLLTLVLPYLEKHLEKRDIMEMRLVSKKWNLSVDDYFGMPACFLEPEEGLRIAENLFYIASPKMSLMHGWNKHNFFKVSSLSNFLNIIQHLRSLQVSSRFQIVDNKPVQLEVSSLPVAPKLERLQMEGPCRFGSSPVIDACMLRYHIQLKELHVDVNTWKRVFNLGWPELQELHLEGVDLDQDLDYNSMMLAVLPNLRKLGLAMKCWSQNSLDRLLRILNKFSAAGPLNSLRLYGRVPDDVAICQAHHLIPSSVTSVEWQHCEMTKSVNAYSILLHFPLLENLNVRYDGEVVYQSKEVRDKAFRSDRTGEGYIRAAREWEQAINTEVVEVNKYAFDDTMYKSNIWKMFPRLRAFTFQQKKWTRDGFELYQSDKNELR